MSEQKRTSEDEQETNRNRDAEDARSTNAPVRPGSGATHSPQLPRGGTR